MTINRAATLFAMILLSGCANFNSIYRGLSIDGNGVGPTGVAIDIKQRAILSNPRTVTKPGEQPSFVVCAEPSPDALSAYVSSLAATGSPLPTSGPSPAAQNSVNVALGISETSGSVGLRTQSIQLLRDLLFSNCLTYMNGASTPNQYYALQRRSQNITLGLLAIEQLTGAVKADQVVLGTSSNAATGADNTDKESSEVKTNQTDLNDAKTKQEAADQKLKQAKGKVNDQKSKLEVARKGAASAKSDLDKLRADANTTAAALSASEQAKATADEGFQVEKTKLEELEEQEAEAQLELAARRRDVITAENFLATAERALADANRRVRASTSANGQFAGSGPTGGRGQVTAKVAEQVSNIVNSVLEFSTKSENCAALVAAALALKSDERLPAPAWYALQTCLTSETKGEPGMAAWKAANPAPVVPTLPPSPAPIVPAIPVPPDPKEQLRLF